MKFCNLSLHRHNSIVRVRKYGDNYNIGIKSGKNLVRLEKEIPISEADFNELSKFQSSNKIHKIRHITFTGKYKIEIDEFLDNFKGLIYAEVEFPDEDEAKNFSPPQWFGKEVTNDHRYTNGYLAKTQQLPPL